MVWRLWLLITTSLTYLKGFRGIRFGVVLVSFIRIFEFVKDVGLEVFLRIQ